MTMSSVSTHSRLMTRRNAMRLGLGALAAGVTTGAAASAMPAAGAGATGATKTKACIVLYMGGGASQIDTWDPKPESANGGEFRAISTATSGVRISEHLPLLARQTQRLAIVRSLTYREGNHARARYLLHTGYVPAGGARHPGLGAQLVGARAEPGALPGNVAIGGPGHTAGLMGGHLSPFVVGDARKPVANITTDVPRDRMDARLEMWRALQSDFGQGRSAGSVSSQSEVIEQAVTMMRAEELEAFALGAESPQTRQRYGPSKFGQGCLMARRLVERGVPFVEVQMGGWDTHDDNFGRVRSLSAELDAGMSALLDDLAATGLLEETVVLWAGDFGRTPRINARGGRDHYPRVASAVLAGGGIGGGQVIGATDPDGEAVIERPLSIQDLHRTLQHQLGMDTDAVRLSGGGRPIYAIDGGELIDELL